MSVELKDALWKFSRFVPGGIPQGCVLFSHPAPPATSVRQYDHCRECMKSVHGQLEQTA
jgi:hypothetical protein